MRSDAALRELLADSDNLRRAIRLNAVRLLRLAKFLHPAFRYIDLMWWLWEQSQSVIDGNRTFRHPAGMVQTQSCPVPPNTDTGVQTRSAWSPALPLWCNINQALPLPADTSPWANIDDPGLWNGYMVLGQITSPPAPPPPNYRWNTLEIWAPIPGVAVPFTGNVIQPVFAPAPLPSWISPPMPMQWEDAQPVAPPLPLRRHAEPRQPGDLPEDTERGDEPWSAPMPYQSPTYLIPFIPGISDKVRLAPSAPPKGTVPKEKQPQYKRRNPKKPKQFEDLDPPAETPRIEDVLPGVRPRAGEVVITKDGTHVQQSTHRNRRPGKRTKERKIRVSMTGTLAGKVFGGVTESIDALDAFYEALPEKLRARARMQRHGKDPRVTVKLQMIYDHYHELDLRKVARNLLENQIEDWFYGQLGQRAQEGLNRSGWKRPLGVEAGNTLGKTPEGAPAPGKNPLSEVLERISDLVVPRALERIRL